LKQIANLKVQINSLKQDTTTTKPFTGNDEDRANFINGNKKDDTTTVVEKSSENDRANFHNGDDAKKSCPKKFYLEEGECKQVTCSKGYFIDDTGRDCLIECKEYFYRSQNGKECLQKQCTGDTTVDKSGKECVSETNHKDFFEGVNSIAQCKGEFLGKAKLFKYSTMINTRLNKGTTCDSSSSRIRAVRYTGPKPPKNYRFIYADEFENN